jgi:hypothetical protein
VIPTARTRKDLCRGATASRGCPRCGPEHPIISELREAGATSLRAIAAGLNARGIKTPRGDGEWSPTQVSRLLDQL